LFQIKKIGKFVHINLVCVVKISYQFNKLWVTQKQFRRRFNHRCFFCNFICYFLTFQSHFAKTMSQLNDIFVHQCDSLLVLKHFIVLIFFHLIRFRNHISPGNVFLEKFQHPFSTLKLIVLQSMWPNDSKFDSCHLQHVHYKIVQLRFSTLVTFRPRTLQKQWCF